MEENYNDWKQLQFTVQENTIIDWSSQNKTKVIPFQYLLTGIDKLHDFGEYFTAIYKLIYTHHFLYDYNNKNANLYGKKIIGTQELVESNLENKVGALHKIIDFNSYKKDTVPILGAPNLIFRISEIDGNKPPYFDFKSKAPFALPPLKINELDVANYMLQLPPERDVILYLKGKKNDFITHANKLNEILNITNEEYVSKDAFPLSQNIIDGMFKRNLDSNFTSYTSEIMDPASQTKIIKSGDGKQIETLFCVLPNEERLFLKVQLDTTLKLKLSFSLQKKNGQLIKGKQPFVLNSSVKTPSIQDVVIYLFMEEYNQLNISESQKSKALQKSYGAKILNAFKRNKKDQQSLANKLKKEYFTPLFSAIPDEAKKTLTQKQLISVATKTIGDQTYLWDTFIHDSIHLPQNPSGSFVVTVDSFLFDQIIHGKNANAVFASKSNGGLLRDAVLGSTYQMAIYLKPLSENAAKEFAEKQQITLNQLTNEYNAEKAKLNVNKENVVDAMNKFKEKRSTVTELLDNMFNRFEPVGRRIPSHYMYNDIQIESFNISNYYYSACYLLQFMIQCEISLSEINLYKIPDSLPTDIPGFTKGISILKTLNGKFDDAKTYYENPLTNITDETILFEYLNQGETVPGVKNEIGLIEPVVGSAPDFESVRNSLNINKSRLDVNLPKGFKLPATIGFSKGFFLIKDTIRRFFQDYNINVIPITGGQNRKRKYLSERESDSMDIDENVEESMSDSMDIDENREESSNYKKRNITIIPETEEDVLEKIKNALPDNIVSELANVSNNSDYVFPPGEAFGQINSLDYYELLFILKQLFYITSDFDTENIYGLQTGGNGKTVDDFYITVYELTVETGLWDYMRDFIQPDILVKRRRAINMQNQKNAQQPTIDVRKLNLKTGRVNSAPVFGNTQEKGIQRPLAQTAGRKKTKKKHKKQNRRSNKLMKTKNRKSKKNKTKKSRKHN